MKIREMMTTNVTSVGPDTTVREAADLMVRLDVGALPVCDGEKVVGILTDRDIVARSTASGREPGLQLVREIMSTNVLHVFEDQDVQEAAWLMEIKRVRRLAVLGTDHRLVGVVSLADLSRLADSRMLSAEVLEHISAPTPRVSDPHEAGSPGWRFSRL